MFSVIGKIGEETLAVQYKDTGLSGDQRAVAKAQIENQKNHGYLGLMPDVVPDHYLDLEIAAYYLMTRFVFESVIAEQNDWEQDEPDMIY
jgi:hypothetical protein